MNINSLIEILENHYLWLRGNGGERADLTRANLSSANLTRANLYGADLTRANLYGVSGCNCDYLVSLFIDTYPVVYTFDTMQIGCEKHLISEWLDFSDHKILEMEGKKALKFWRKYKEWIFKSIELCPAKSTSKDDNNE